MSGKLLLNKKLAFVIAFNGYQDIEYGEPKRILEEAGALIKTVSTQRGEAKGKLGGRVKIDLTLEEVNLDDFDGVVFVGGPGMVEQLDNSRFHQLAQKAKEKGKVIGAICIAPAMLAKAGILSGKQATVWNSEDDKEPIEILEKGGAEFLNQPVVIDNKIVTANGPQAAKEFGQSLVKVLLDQNND